MEHSGQLVASLREKLRLRSYRSSSYDEGAVAIDAAIVGSMAELDRETLINMESRLIISHTSGNPTRPAYWAGPMGEGAVFQRGAFPGGHGTGYPVLIN